MKHTGFLLHFKGITLQNTFQNNKPTITIFKHTSENDLNGLI